MTQYNEKVIEHAKHPRNEGKLENPDSVGEVISPICGDSLDLYIKVEDNVIVDVGFETMGCAASIATSSMVTELAKGKTLDEAMKITKEEIIDSLGGLPNVKMHCSSLAISGLYKAILEYKKKNNIELTEQDKRIEQEIVEGTAKGAKIEHEHENENEELEELKSIPVIKPCSDDPKKVTGESYLSGEVSDKDYLDIEKLCPILQSNPELNEIKCSLNLGLAKFKIGIKTITVFKNGKIIITMAEDEKDVLKTIEKVKEILKESVL